MIQWRKRLFVANVQLTVATPPPRKFQLPLNRRHHGLPQSISSPGTSLPNTFNEPDGTFSLARRPPLPAELTSGKSPHNLRTLGPPPCGSFQLSDCPPPHISHLGGGPADNSRFCDHITRHPPRPRRPQTGDVVIADPDPARRDGWPALLARILRSAASCCRQPRRM